MVAESPSMAERFVSIPRVFASGDIEEWFQPYEICSLANGWKEEEKALRIPTLLEKEAFAVYLEHSPEERKDYRQASRSTIHSAS